MPSAESQFWKYSFAYGSLGDARCALEQLAGLGARADSEDSEGQGLWCWFFVSYARPFTDNKDVGMISSNMVAGEYKQIHECFMQMRRSVIAHTDPSAEIAENVAMNQLIFEKDDKGNLHPQVQIPLPPSDQIPKFLTIVDSIMERVGAEMVKAFDSMDSDAASLPVGRYVFDYNAAAGSRWKRSDSTSSK